MAKRMARIGSVVFSHRLVLKTSARRFREHGNFRTFATYVFHFFRTILPEKKRGN
jgi:hypothetical protein